MNDSSKISSNLQKKVDDLFSLQQVKNISFGGIKANNHKKVFDQRIYLRVDLRAI